MFSLEEWVKKVGADNNLDLHPEEMMIKKEKPLHAGHHAKTSQPELPNRFHCNIESAEKQ